MSKPEKMVAVYEASNEAEALILQSVLKDHGIPSMLRPRSSLPSAYAPMQVHGAVSILVLTSLADKAKELIASDTDGETV